MSSLTKFLRFKLNASKEDKLLQLNHGFKREEYKPNMNTRITSGYYSLFGVGRAEVIRHNKYHLDAAGKKLIDSVFFSGPVGVNPAMGATKCWLAKTEVVMSVCSLVLSVRMMTSKFIFFV